MIGEPCDWGGCDEFSVAERMTWDGSLLPVCAEHMTEKGWIVVSPQPPSEVVPNDDWIGHEEGWAGMTCPCGPRLEIYVCNGCALIVHQALDGRE